MPRKIDQFGRKRCQNKRKDVSYQLVKELFQKYFAVKNSFSTYVWSKVDSYFCEAVNLIISNKLIKKCKNDGGT